MSETQTIYRNAFTKYGLHAQIDKMSEEMSELNTALMHFKYNRKNNVHEEMADVLIVWEQLYAVLNKEGDIDRWKEHKIERLGERVG